MNKFKQFLPCFDKNHTSSVSLNVFIKYNKLGKRQAAGSRQEQEDGIRVL